MSSFLDGAAALGFFIAFGGSYKVGSSLLKLYLEIKTSFAFSNLTWGLGLNVIFSSLIFVIIMGCDLCACYDVDWEDVD